MLGLFFCSNGFSFYRVLATTGFNAGKGTLWILLSDEFEAWLLLKSLSRVIKLPNETLLKANYLDSFIILLFRLSLASASPARISLNLSKRALVKKSNSSWIASNLLWSSSVFLYWTWLFLDIAMLVLKFMISARTLKALLFFFIRASKPNSSDLSVWVVWNKRVKKESCWFFYLIYSLNTLFTLFIS